MVSLHLMLETRFLGLILFLAKKDSHMYMVFAPNGGG